MDNPLQVVRMRDLPKLVGLSRSALYQAIARSEFPTGFRLTKHGRAVGWRLADIQRWVDSQVEKSAASPK